MEGSRAVRAEDVQEAIDLLLTTPTFKLIGMTLPRSHWLALDEGVREQIHVYRALA